MAPELGVGLVGYGGIGRIHALCYRMLPIVYPDLPASARIVGVATRSEASAARARRNLGDVMVTTDLGELMSHAEVAIIDCCTPTDDHLSVAEAAFMAGKGLFCEKPLAATAEDAAAITALAHQYGRRGGVNFHVRFIPAIQEARRRIEAGLLGDIYGFHLRYYRSSNLRRDRPISWRFLGPGSGVLLDLGSHLIDLVEYLLGPIARVAAHTRTLIPERPGPNGELVCVEGDDVVWLQLELSGLGRGTIEASKIVPGAADDIRVEAYGSRGALIFDMADPNGLVIVDGMRAGASRRIATLNDTQPPAALPGPETSTGWMQWHLASIAAFLRAFATNGRPQPDLEDGLRVNHVIAAAFRSAKQEGAMVAV